MPVPPPRPASRLTRWPTAGCLTHLMDRRRRVGIYAGLGCVDAGPALAAVAELLQAPVATSVSGKGCIPDCPSPGGRLGLRQTGNACGGGRIQGCRPRAGRRRPL